MEKVGDAIILAGGMGTRMLPASLYMPKETLPLIDTPIINHLIWEAAKAGVSRVHLVLSKNKKDILSRFLTKKAIFEDGVRTDLPRDSLSLGVKGLEIIPHVQEYQGGVGDAINVAIDSIEGPFLVLLGDMILLEEHNSPVFSGPENASNASTNLVERFEENGLPCIGLSPVDRFQVSNYGVADISGGMVSRIVEKPTFNKAPSNYVLCGRYLLPKGTAKILRDFPVSEFGELQSIYLLNHFIDNGGVNAVKFDEMQMYDSGEPLSWLKSQIDHGLRRSDISEELSKWLIGKIS